MVPSPGKWSESARLVLGPTLREDDLTTWAAAVYSSPGDSQEQPGLRTIQGFQKWARFLVLSALSFS